MSRVRDTRLRHGEHRESNGLDLDRDPVAINRFRLPPSVSWRNLGIRVVQGSITAMSKPRCLPRIPGGIPFPSARKLFASRRQPNAESRAFDNRLPDEPSPACSLKIFVTTACKHSACSPDYRFRDAEARDDAMVASMIVNRAW